MRLLTDHPEVDLTVFFLSDQSTKTYHDKGFGQDIKWDVPLTDGYAHEFLNSTENCEEHSLFNPRVSLRSLRKALKSQAWDAIWIHGYNNTALLYSIMYSKQHRIPLFFRSDSNLNCSPKRFLKDQFLTSLTKHCSALLWVGADNRDFFRHYGAKSTQLFFTPYAVDNSFFQEHQSNLRASNKKTTFLYASKFTKRKHAPLLLNAFSRLDIAIRDQAELWFIGDGEDKAKLEKMIANENLHDQVKLLGFKNQTELPRYFDQCDVFVLPSEREPYGLVVNEAMNLAMPIISTDEVGASRDLVEQGVNGWVTRAGDLTSLKEALEAAIRNKKDLPAMGKASLRKITDWNYEKDVVGIVEALKAI